MGNISDISSWENDEFYNESGGFFTISDFIATYEEHEQEVFNVLAYHKKGATSLDIEKSILKNAIMTVGFKDEDADDFIDGYLIEKNVLTEENKIFCHDDDVSHWKYVEMKVA